MDFNDERMDIIIHYLGNVQRRKTHEWERPCQMITSNVLKIYFLKYIKDLVFI